MVNGKFRQYHVNIVLEILQHHINSFQNWFTIDNSHKIFENTFLITKYKTILFTKYSDIVQHSTFLLYFGTKIIICDIKLYYV